MMPGFVTVGGVFINSSFLGVRDGRKYPYGNGWILSTVEGKEIARFDSEESLDTFWVAFQKSQKRNPNQLLSGPPTAGPINQAIIVINDDARKKLALAKATARARAEARANAQARAEAAAKAKAKAMAEAKTKQQKGIERPAIRVVQPPPVPAMVEMPAKKSRLYRATETVQQTNSKSPTTTNQPPRRGRNKNLTTTIGGITIDASLADVWQGRKYYKKKLWRLTAEDGRMIATFATEEELDKWWVEFQTSQGRPATQLIPKRCVPPSVPIKTRRGKSPTEGRTFEDYQQPWSRDYDMPLFDAN